MVDWLLSPTASAAYADELPPRPVNEGGRLNGWLIAATLIVTGAFFVTEHAFGISREESYANSAEQMEESAETGTMGRRVCFLIIGLLGALGLVQPREHDDSGHSDLQWRNGMAVLILLFIGWCGISLFWSIDPATTSRRLVVLGCCFVGALGISRHVSLRELCWMVLSATTFFLLVGIAAELAFKTFRPFSSDFRFAGSVHPNTQALYLTMFCFATACLARQEPEQRSRWLAAFAIGFVFLLMTRSRAALAGTLLGLAALFSSSVSLRTKFAGWIAVGWLATLAGIGLLVSGIDGKDVSAFFLLGRDEDATSLTGRVPLWTELATYVARRPLIGYGYDSFWNADHIGEISETMEWAINGGHCGYLDLLLSVGAIGAVLVVSCVVLGLRRALRAYDLTRDAGYGFILALLVCALAHAVLESGMVMPFFTTFIAACGLCRLAFLPPEEESLLI